MEVDLKEVKELNYKWSLINLGLYSTHPVPNLCIQEWFEDIEDHIEDSRIENHVNLFDAHWTALLHPIRKCGREHGRDLHKVS